MATPVKIISMAVSALAILWSQGCVIHTEPPIPGSGVLALQDRETKEFDEIEINCQAKVIVTIGEQPSVVVQTDDNLIDLIETRVSRDTLRIDCDRNISPINAVTITITTPSLTDLEIRGSADVDIQGISERSFDLTISGSGDVVAVGTVSKLEASIRGSGSMQLEGLIAQDVEVSITGSGDAFVHAEDELDARITGSGDIIFTGNPKRLERHITGSGEIQPKE